MEFAIWAYPWDLLDEGVQNVTDDLRDIGITEINLATNYHTVQGFLPHNPKRRTFFSEASAFFQPSDEYGEIRPVTNEEMGDSCWLSEVVAELPPDFNLTSWTIGCHNSTLGSLHPDATLETPFGDDLRFGLCPSNPKVQQYLKVLVSDLDSRNVFDRIELESFDYFHGRGFGWHHDKFHTTLGKLGEFLFGLCCCEHCRNKAEAAGINAEKVASTCRKTIDELAEGKLSTDVSPETWLDAHPDVNAYVEQRTQTLTDLIAQLAELTEANIGYYPLLDPEDAWMHGADLSKIADKVDYIKVISYKSNPNEARRAVQSGRLLSGEPVHAGVLPGDPHVHDQKTLAEIVDAIASQDAERISFYNYGLLPERNLDWIDTVISDY